MTELVDFLLARIAEEEERARAAGGEWWHATEMPPPGMRRRGDEKTHWIVDSPATLVSYEVTQADMAEHIAAWSPARVLTDCEARRRLVETTQQFWDDPQKWDAFGAESAYEFLILSHLAVPYSDHPDFRPEWAVS